MAFFSFNGITKDYVRVLRGLERPAWAPIEHEILEIPGRPGGVIAGKKIKIRQINIPVRIYTKEFESLQKVKEDLAAWLITDDPKELIFSDEPDRVYYAQVTGELNLDELVEWGEGVISFICPDPYKYGPLRTQTINVPPASFSRNSVAYLSDGTQVGNDVPRFETVSGRTGVLIEEGTTNAAVILSDLRALAIGASLERDGRRYTRLDEHTYRVEYLQDVSGVGVSYITENITWITDQRHTISAEVVDYYLAPGSIGYFGIGRGSYGGPHLHAADGKLGRKVHVYDDAGVNVGSVGLAIRTASSSHLIKAGSYMVFRFVQAELNRAYATSWTLGGTTRAAETLTLPTDGVLNPEEGTIECRFYYKPNGTYQRIISFIGPAAFNGYNDLQFDITSTGYVRFQPYRAGGGETAISVLSKNPISEGWHFACCSWNQNEIKIAVDNQPIVRRTYGGGIAALDSFFTIAKEHKMNSKFLNNIISELRLSRIARSDAEIMDAYQNGFTVDEYTTAYLPFDGSLEVQTPNVVENKGTADADPVFTLYVQQPTTFAMIQNQDNEYMMIGKPADVEQTTVDTRTLLLEERGATLGTWSSSPTQIDAVDAVVTGSFATDGDGITVASYGSGPRYHGPALIKEVPVTQDFEVEMHCEARANKVNEVYRIEFYLFDEALNVLGKMAVRDVSTKLHQVDVEARYGPFVGNNVHYMMSAQNYSYKNWNYYRGIIRMRRIGRTFEFYTARINEKGEHYYTLQKQYVDNEGAYLGRLKYVQIHIGTFGTYDYPGKTGGVQYYAKINYIRAYRLATITVDQTPYIALPGDKIEFNFQTKQILINGEDRRDLKDFGARFFKLKKGANALITYPFDAFTATCDYRERYI